MNNTLQLMLASRKAILALTDQLTIEQLNQIPRGMNNNIIWNMAHLIAVQQDRCYVQSGLDTYIPPAFLAAYKNGTKPETAVDITFYNLVSEQLTSHIALLENDYIQGKFNGFVPFTPRSYSGVSIETIEDAFQFVLLHEGLHQGYIRQLRKLLLP